MHLKFEEIWIPEWQLKIWKMDCILQLLIYRIGTKFDIAIFLCHQIAERWTEHSQYVISQVRKKVSIIIIHQLWHSIKYNKSYIGNTAFKFQYEVSVLVKTWISPVTSIFPSIKAIPNCWWKSEVEFIVSYVYNSFRIGSCCNTKYQCASTLASWLLIAVLLYCCYPRERNA